MVGGDGPAPAAGVRDQVLTFMKDRARSGTARRPEPPVASASVKAFSELPEYKQVAAQRAAGEQLGIGNPFYQTHLGTAGATTVIGDRTLINFASYDYLGLNSHPQVRQTAHDAIERYGVSASASRLVAGERPTHSALEDAVAAFYGVEAAVVFVSGYLTNVTTLGTLLGPQDFIIHDELMHNSALVGAKLSGAHRRFFKHNDIDDLDRILNAFAGQYRRVLVLVEGVYSMDGDIADLPRLIQLRSQHGFWLMVDEAHALGVLGARGRGTFEHLGCDPRDVDIWMGTLSKTTASCGGYIAGSEALATLLKGLSGGFVYSVGLPPALAASARVALDLILQEPERVARLRRNGAYFGDLAKKAGLNIGVSAGYSVVPVLVGDSLRAVQLANDLHDEGVNVMPIIHPAVPEGQARLRFFVTSEHTAGQIEMTVERTAEKLKRLEERKFGIASIDVEAVLRKIAGET